jgi:mevalonate kinase
MPNTPSHNLVTHLNTYAHGKLLLTGEYAVLDGATALAIPVKFGQSLRVDSWKERGRLSWTGKNENGKPWFLAEFELPGLEILTTTNNRIAQTLAGLFAACQKQNPDFLSGDEGFKALTQNDFPRLWGLGTSSTLIATLGKWAGVDPYKVLFNTLGGSGYDIACAYAEGPILYRLDHQVPTVEPAVFKPDFAGNLYFVYLDKKQDSRNGIQLYKSGTFDKQLLGRQITGLADRMLRADILTEFEAIMLEHENLIVEALRLPRAKTLYFEDFWGEIKSLGAWGGDFVMATSQRPAEETRAYFKEKGFETVLNWEEMIG